MGPRPHTDEGGVEVGHHYFLLALVHQPHHASQLGNGALLRERSHSRQEDVLASGAQLVSLLCALHHLHDQISVLWHDSSGQDGDNAGDGEILPRELVELAHPGEEFRVFLGVMEVEVESGSLVLIEIIGVSAEQGPGTVLRLEVVPLEAFVVLSEGKPPKVK